MFTRVTRVACGLLLFALAACSEPPADDFMQNSAGAPMEVGVVTLASQPVTLTTELPGRVIASVVAEVRPQVNGIVRRQVFREGTEVQQGDVLYEIDSAAFQAAYSAAAASLQRAMAGMTSAQTTFDRTERLAASRTVSVQDVDNAQMALLQAQADVAVAEAALQAAQIDLDNTLIRAEIPGLIGTSSVSVGSLVTANQTTALATIRQIDSVYVDLANSSADLLRMRAQAEAGNLGRIDAGTEVVQLTLEDGSSYTEAGTISLSEVVVSETTGTYSLRATFANPRRLLMPGMFVRATVGVGISPRAYLVPQRAVTRNAAGEATAFFVSDTNKAQSRTLVTGRAIGNDWLVTGGVADGDRVIVDRLQLLRDGMDVLPLAVQIDSNGVIKQEISNAQQAGTSTLGGS